MRAISSFLKDDSGASAAEYALILAIIASAIVAAMLFLGNAIQTAVNNAGTSVQGAHP